MIRQPRLHSYLKTAIISPHTLLFGALILNTMPIVIPNISISSINCNSLNISSIGSFNQKLKIYGIVSLRTDIIMMSDIRLCNAQGTSSSGEIATAFRITPYGSYEFFHNSSQNKRGVGVLIKRSASISVLNK